MKLLIMLAVLCGMAGAGGVDTVYVYVPPNLPVFKIVPDNQSASRWWREDATNSAIIYLIQQLDSLKKEIEKRPVERIWKFNKKTGEVIESPYGRARTYRGR